MHLIALPIFIIATASLAVGLSLYEPSPNSTESSTTTQGTPSTIAPIAVAAPLGLAALAGAPAPDVQKEIAPAVASIDQIVPIKSVDVSTSSSTTKSPGETSTTTATTEATSLVGGRIRPSRNSGGTDQQPKMEIAVGLPAREVDAVNPINISPVVDTIMPGIRPMVMPPLAPEVMPTLPSPETLPDDVKLLKSLIANRDETIISLNAEITQLKERCDRPGPIGIMPSYMPMFKCPPPVSDEMGCAQILRAKDEEMEGLRDRVRTLETRVSQSAINNAKPVKKQIEIIVTQKKSNSNKKGKQNDKVKSSTVNPTMADCQSALDYEKTITTALQRGVIERDVQITNLQESLKNAEDRVTNIQNSEINACSIKTKHIETDLQRCREEKKGKCSSANIKFPIANTDDEDDDDEDFSEEDDEQDMNNDKQLRSEVLRILMLGAIKNRFKVINLRGSNVKFQRRFENKVPVITLGEKEYYFHNNSKVPWKTAYNNCEKRNMRLVSIEHDEENALVSAEIGNAKFNYWTSGQDTSGKGEFQWKAIQKSFNNFMNWAPDQPLNGDPKRQCVSAGPVNDIVMWKVEDCNSYLYYICESKVGSSYST